MNDDDANCNLDDEAVNMMDHFEHMDDASVSISRDKFIYCTGAHVMVHEKTLFKCHMYWRLFEYRNGTSGPRNEWSMHFSRVRIVQGTNGPVYERFRL